MPNTDRNPTTDQTSTAHPSGSSGAVATDSSGLVLREDRGPVTWLRINRPDKLNALSGAVIESLGAALAAVDADPRVKVIVLTGTGRAFSVGYDIAEEVELGVSRAEDWHAGLTRNVALTMQVWGLSKPVIGAVNGFALAGGCELAMGCDLLIASEEAEFGEPEIRFGSGPVTLLMPFMIGAKKTAELLLTGDTIDARSALDIGLINGVVPAADLETTVDALAAKIALTPTRILQFTKLSLNRAYQAMGLTAAVNNNLDLAGILNGTHTKEREDFSALVASEGLRAALAWRDARYAGHDSKEY